MNPELPNNPRKALEPSLTALLLGELPEDQARFLRQAIATDSELAKNFETLKQTIELVRQTQTDPIGEPKAQQAPLKLNENRRQELLRRFKTLEPIEFKQRMRSRIAWLMPAAAAAVVLVLAALALAPRLSRSRTLILAGERASDSERLQQLRPIHQPGSKGSAALPFSSEGKPSQNDKYGVVAQTEVLARRQSGANAPASPANRAPETPSSTARNNIVLPMESPPETAMRGANLVQNEKRDANDDLKSQVVIAGDLKLAEATLPSQSTTIAEGLTTFSRAKLQDGIAVLGDSPAAGRFFRSQTDATNIEGLSWDTNRLEFLGYDDPGAFVPQAEVAVVGGVVVPVPSSSMMPLPHFGLREVNEPTLNLKDEEQLAAAQTTRELQGLTNNYYAGAFGGFSTVQPEAGQLAQQLQPITIQGMGEVSAVPNLQTELAQDSRKQPASPPMQAGSGKTSESLERKLALAELDAGAKDKAELRQKEIAANTVGKPEAAKKVETQLSKNLALSVRNDRRSEQEDMPAAKPAIPPLLPQPEIQTRENRFSTFSLNVSDVSFKLSAASLEQGKLPDPAGVRVEEFINAFDYRDPEPANDQPVVFAWDRARDPFAQNRDLLRFSIKTAAAGRQPGRPLNIVLLLDNSGSMERADRVRIIHEALKVLATQLQATDTLSVVTFARTARLWVDGVPGDQAGRIADELDGLTPQGGTNLEQAMDLAYQTALRHYLANGINRVVLLTDGAANLGDTDPEALKKKAETNRIQGIALDCFGIGWEDYNDDLLEVLTRNGDGRYGFLNTPEEAASEFAGQLAGALHVAAADVKVQVEFNPRRVASYRQVGYARHQLTKEQFRDNSVDAAQIGAAESGNALYVIEANPEGEGPIGQVRVRYKVPGSTVYREHEWTVPYTGSAIPLEQAATPIRLAATAAGFAEWLSGSPHAAEVTPDRLSAYLSGISRIYGADPRPQKLEWMLHQAKAISGK